VEGFYFIAEVSLGGTAGKEEGDKASDRNLQAGSGGDHSSWLDGNINVALSLGTAGGRVWCLEEYRPLSDGRYNVHQNVSWLFNSTCPITVGWGLRGGDGERQSHLTKMD